MKRTLGACCSLLLLAAGAQAPAAPLWSSDFEDVRVGSEPDGALVLQGEFLVAQEDGDKFLELPGSPLETMGLLVGPARRDGVSVTARAMGERKGRQSPSFGVGLCGARGYRLMVVPMRNAVELVREEDLVARIEYKWVPGRWTWLRLSVSKVGESSWAIRGQVWAEGQSPAEGCTIDTQVDDPPPSGGASLWGVPYSGRPIRYDDLTYKELEPPLGGSP